MSSFITLNSNDKKTLSTDFKAGDIGKRDPFSGQRAIAFDDGRTRAGTASFDGAEAIDYFPHWELLIVTAGALLFEFDGIRAGVPTGCALIISKGSRFKITAEAPATWTFLSVSVESQDNPEPAVLTFLDREAELFASASVDKEILISAAPTCRNHRMHVRQDIGVRAGVWDSTPYERTNVEQKEHELMHITRGEVCFSDDLGRSEVYSVGETFLVPKGVQGKWTSNAHVAKIYAVVS